MTSADSFLRAYRTINQYRDGQGPILPTSFNIFSITLLGRIQFVGKKKTIGLKVVKLTGVYFAIMF